MHEDRASEVVREAAVITALILAVHARAVLDTSSDGQPQPDRQTPVPSIGLVRTHLEQAPETPGSRPINQIGRDLVNSSSAN
ncbi:hypothetical protein OH797_01315 [Streptomyces anulatus]|uniref:hypothetical protein n=1 Tax=Streptomyces TaxID=1883 RepID=UPI0006A077D0|nr:MULTISPECIES: hypothetical protein [Streptomyces]KND23740.1 hypothetical protein IQ60_36655 [Streptomyces europaeiscabiei]MDF9808742.1 hypothetical protein [Streptomyces sp. HB372]WSR80480.1 hypothetical protein OG274_36870 [Streptomyces anulatus]WTC75729.1 hypothetical protein OG882_37535 [Streptomyces anulatus]WUC84811.1 hypothetical protein OHQ35_01490 [Streptomyces anulatus]